MTSGGTQAMEGVHLQRTLSLIPPYSYLLNVETGNKICTVMQFKIISNGYKFFMTNNVVNILLK